LQNFFQHEGVLSHDDPFPPNNEVLAPEQSEGDILTSSNDEALPSPDKGATILDSTRVNPFSGQITTDFESPDPLPHRSLRDWRPTKRLIEDSLFGCSAFTSYSFKRFKMPQGIVAYVLCYP
jgi:hypothetical protein